LRRAYIVVRIYYTISRRVARVKAVMECPKCKSELEIFSRGDKDIYVCPLCLSVLLEDIQSVKILKYFCKKELLANIISNILDDSLFADTKEMLS